MRGRFHWRAGICAALSAWFCVGCNLAPKYQKPPVDTPPAYKELTPADYPNTDGWKVAQPSDATLRGKWWEIFNDPQLNALEEKVNVSNQNIVSEAAAFMAAARAMVKEARAQLLTVTVNPSITAQRQSANLVTIQPTGGTGGTGTGTGTGTATVGRGTYVDYSLPFDATWQPDLFGRIRNTIRAAASVAQSDAADVENTRLTVQAELANDYFQLRGQDALKQLLDATVKAYQESLDLTKALYQTGIDNEEAVTQAETQLESTEAQDVALGVERAEFEHAIAMLTGQPASTFTIAFEPLDAGLPADPVGHAVSVARTPPGHRRGRAPGGASQRANRSREGRVLSHGYAQRDGWSGEHLVPEVVFVAQPVFLRRAVCVGDSLRRRTAAGYRPAIQGPI